MVLAPLSHPPFELIHSLGDPLLSRSSVYSSFRPIVTPFEIFLSLKCNDSGQDKLFSVYVSIFKIDPPQLVRFVYSYTQTKRTKEQTKNHTVHCIRLFSHHFQSLSLLSTFIYFTIFSLYITLLDA
ncbi:hypothetical protein QVD17_40459 [Tagetes erecta]|uniref:Uncharacterized protein n=1 Tax=Tagetes erecta TaxID=13708 RepID=A0AAD8NHU9_TARER|nr:hypothetical protein QVD17_40459 [Tagetes erecta]